MHAPRIITLSDIDLKWTKTMRFIPATWDQFVVKEVLIDEVYDFNFKPTDIVLNLGGNIWAFDVFAYDRVKEIITFEPDPNCFQSLLWHLEKNDIGNVTAINAAIAPNDWVVELSIGNETGHNSCVIHRNDQYIIEVPCFSMLWQIEKYRPNKIKCDIEWFEYAIFGIDIPDFVDEIWLETHTFSPEQHKMHQNLCDKFMKTWFKVRVLKNDPSNRTFLVHAKR